MFAEVGVIFCPSRQGPSRPWLGAQQDSCTVFCSSACWFGGGLTHDMGIDWRPDCDRRLGQECPPWQQSIACPGHVLISQGRLRLTHPACTAGTTKVLVQMVHLCTWWCIGLQTAGTSCGPWPAPRAAGQVSFKTETKAYGAQLLSFF